MRTPFITELVTIREDELRREAHVAHLAHVAGEASARARQTGGLACVPARPNGLWRRLFAKHA